MKYFKVICDGNITDVLKDPVWVKCGTKNRIIRCDVYEAAGVVSSDSEILHILGMDEFTDGNLYKDVAIADIDENEYEELKTLLGIGAVVTDESQNVVWEDEPAVDEEIQEDETVKEVKVRCLEKLSETCRKTICGGIDVRLSDGKKRHYDLELEDQLNLMALEKRIAAGETSLPYHASGELCTYYSAEDITTIIKAAAAFKEYHTTYFNSLKNWINAMRSISKIGAVAYGDEIPEKYCSDILLSMKGTGASENDG